MHLLEPRDHPSIVMKWLSPIIALLAMLIVGGLVFLALGKNPLEAFQVFFIEPLSSWYGWSELMIKASPLILIALGLSIGFKARIFNIGAEGQLIVGAICGGGLAIACQGISSFWVLPTMVIAGAIGGALWGALPALLKTHFNAQETLTTLMLNYIAMFILLYLINGPWKDPMGMNFPQSVMFDEGTLFPILFEGTRMSSIVLLTVFAVFAFWIFNKYSFLAYQLEVGGQAPDASRYAGFSAKQAVWLSLMISGLMAGIAGIGEVAGPIGQLNPNISPGYGYAAIIVAYLGRLNPIGIVLSGFLMALLYIGGETAQLNLQLPSAITGLFQGMLLFFLLAADAFIENRYRFGKSKKIKADHLSSTSTKTA